MKFSTFAGASVLAVVAALAAGSAVARDQVRIVGSSTVFPFSTQVAEQFGKLPGQKTPVVESTGTGGGFQAFCKGVGEAQPDISNASRRIKKSELDECAKNGVSVTEVPIGFDGIVYAYAASGPQINVTTKELFLASAKTVPVGGQMVANPYKKWNEINPSLPANDIIVYGPAPNHGTRDAVVELVLDAGCDQVPEIKALPAADKKKVCNTTREDGAWVDIADAYNVTVDRTLKTPGSVGIIGFGFYDNNRSKLKAMTVNGVEATFDNIASSKYPVARSMYFYIKREHVGVIPGLKEFVAEFTSKKAIGDDGYTVEKGLIPLSKAALEKVQKDAAGLAKMEGVGS
jgi:phosphate transport system substrate-binding protein